MASSPKYSLLKKLAQPLVPWLISAAALYYVFGVAIDWEKIPEATRAAHIPLFVAIVAFDKIVFFLVWGLLQARVVRQFLASVRVGEILAVKGASELMRSVNNSLSDASFFFGIWQLTGQSLALVVAVIFIPFIAHFVVLVVQASIALPFLPGGLAGNHDVSVVVGISWAVLAVLVWAARHDGLQRLLAPFGLTALVGRVRLTDWIPYIGYFVLFGIFDVVVQGLASRAFGIEIGWLALTARIPVLYVALLIPTFANFGTREIAWANLFSEFGDPAALYAYAFWTNVIFMAMHVLIGVIFLPRAYRLVSEMRAARKRGEEMPQPMLHDAIDP
jgi:hypothetical protein